MHQLCVRPCCFSRETSSDNWLQVAASEPNAWALSASEARCSEAVAAVLLRSCCISSDTPWACGFQAASMRAVRSRRRCSPRASTASSSSRRVPSSARIDAAAFEFEEVSSLSMPSSATSAAARRSEACSAEVSLEAATSDETSAEVLACSFASSAASQADSSATPAATAAAASLAASLAAVPEASSAIRDSIPASMHCKEARLLAASSRMKSSASSISSRSPALTATSSSRLAAARPSTELRNSSRKSSAAPALPPLSSRMRTTIDWQLCNSAPKVPHS
mmetsp:Transcript_64400/g.185014  ORF Transcript_64400/g.185014 Transcript_64400/m.185014 type:complete len:280 (-) Transcript_64400:933-1772(-)